MEDQEKNLEKYDSKEIDFDEKQMELELGIPKTLRTEFNFLKFPFFDLSKDSNRTKIKIEESIDTKDGKVQVLWLVTRDVESQFPGDFEKRLHRAIEQIVNATPKPIENPLRLGSLRYIASIMGIHTDSGKNYQDIQKAFKNIVKASIEADGTYQLKESRSKKYIKDTFHLYDRVIFKGDEMPDGKSADCAYLMLGSWYLRNINNNYVVPLDWRFYNQLSGAITTRMYEYLSIYFYAALERNYHYHDVRYSQICDYFPIKKQYPAWKAHKQLKRAHDSLTKSVYFEKVEWFDLTEPDDWLIRYWIGQRAKDEYEKNRREIRRFGVTSIKPVPIPERRRRQRQIEEAQEPLDGSETMKQLTDRGLAPNVAKKLIQSHSEAYLNHKIIVFEFLMDNNSHLVKSNPAGFLRKSIEEDYTDPPNFISEEEREQRDKKAAYKKKCIEWQRKVDEYKRWIETPPDKLVYGELLLWEKDYREKHGQAPAKEEKVLKQQELIKKLPTNEELQIKLFSKVVFNSEKSQSLEEEIKKIKANIVGVGDS